MHVIEIKKRYDTYKVLPYMMSNFSYSDINMVQEKLFRLKQFLQSNYMVHISGSRSF